MNIYGSPYQLARFLRKDGLREQGTRVHAAAFMPPEKLLSSRLEVSCFEVQGLNQDEVFDIATVNNITLNRKPPIGYAVIHEHRFPTKLLSIDQNNQPPRHVDIIGWEKLSKEDRIEAAARLAEIASENIVTHS